jgi:hypothetical protein
MPYIEFPRGTPRRLAAMERVIEECRAYQGEPIVRGEHPLWHAVVELEKLSRMRTTESCQKFKLDKGPDTVWFVGLWASRPDMPNVPLEGAQKTYMYFGQKDPPEPGLAKAWIGQLGEMLSAILAAERQEPL